MENKISFKDSIDQKVFNAIYSRSLVYNTCWEDPAVDRQALNLTADDVMVVITSAGCNVLDYALEGPKRIHAVDANPRQTALLELKLAGIRKMDYQDFFAVFGEGYHPQFREVYYDTVRKELGDFSRDYWDKNLSWFASRRGSFYFHGLSGFVAKIFSTYLALRPNLAEPVNALFETTSLEEQRQIYDEKIHPQMWGKAMNWAISRQITMSLLGVPGPQRKEVIAQHEGGVAGFIRASIEYVFRQLPMWDNYFWSVYIRGKYGEHCCPEYLKYDNFLALKNGLADRISLHTTTVTEFLDHTDDRISRYVLLDHMDWMAGYYPEALRDEWRAIFATATPEARILFRSAHAKPAYLEKLQVEAKHGNSLVSLRDRLHFHDELAMRLQREDRVHTYAGFHIADISA
ncbi:MAG: BtaA family protein [Methylophilus sp.]|nr:BtaA family protein [Methylophilus sp.]